MLSLPMITCRYTAIVLALLLTPPAAIGAEPPDAPPVLLSTTGGNAGTPWKDLAGLRKAVEAGDPKACLQLGMRYETGENVPLDFAQARTLYEKAACGGVAEAIYRLGKLHQDGLGVGPDPDLAHDLYREAALADVPLAQYNLGAMLVSARGVRRDYVEGLAWLILASRNRVEADGEQRVRAHLAGNPEAVASAEKRAEELSKEVAARRGTKPVWPLPAPESSLPMRPPAIVKPAVSRPALEPPKFELPPPPVLSPPLAAGTERR